MKLEWLRSDIASARRATTFLVVLLSGSLLVNVVLAFLTVRMSDRERVVLVPPTINKTFWVESERVSAEYLQQMAYFLMQLTLDVTPQSVDHQASVVLQYAAPASFGELRTAARVWIIDVGRSYEKACRNFGGSFIEFTENAGLSLNPFTFVDDIDEDMELLQPLLAQMVSPREPLDGFQYSTLGAAIKKVWRAKGREMTVTDIHDLLATGRLDEPSDQDGIAPVAEGEAWHGPRRGR